MYGFDDKSQSPHVARLLKGVWCSLIHSWEKWKWYIMNRLAVRWIKYWLIDVVWNAAVNRKTAELVHFSQGPKRACLYLKAMQKLLLTELEENTERVWGGKNRVALSLRASWAGWACQHPSSPEEPHLWFVEYNGRTVTTVYSTRT